MNSMIRAILKKYRHLLISLAITASLGLALVVGLASGYNSLTNTLDEYLAVYAYPDAVISTDVTNVDEKEKLLEIPGVTGVDPRISADTMMLTEDGEYLSARIFSYAEEEKQGFYFWDKADSAGKESVYLEYRYADTHKIKAGDTVSFRFREEYRPFFVAGIVSRPETISVKLSERAWGLNDDFGYVYAPIELLAKEYEKDYNKAKQEIDEKGEELEEEIASAKKTLKEKEKELEDAKAQLKEQQDLFDKSSAEAEEMLNTLKENRTELLRALKELENNRNKLKDTDTSTKALLKDLKEKKELLEQAKQGLAEINANEPVLKERLEVMDLLQTTGIIPALEALPQETMIQDMIREANVLTDEEIMRQILSIIYTGTLEDLERQANVLLGMMADVPWEKDLMDTTVAEILNIYRTAYDELKTASDELTTTKQYILSRLAEAGIAETDIDSSLVELEKGIAECEDGLIQISDALRQIDSGIKQLKDGRDELNAGIRQMEKQMEEELGKARKELADAEQQIRDGEEELRKRTKEAMTEFANLEEELDRAYRELDENEGYEKLCNQFLIYMDEKADKDAVLRKAESLLSETIEVNSSYTCDDSPVRELIGQTQNVLETLAVYCPIVFYLITMGITFLFMSMIIKQSRRDIGILRALGFAKKRIRGMFCLVSVIVSIAGTLIGTGIASWILWYTGSYYKDFFPLPYFNYEMDGLMFIVGIFSTTLVCLVATLITTGSVSRVMPKEAMSRPVQEKFKMPKWAAWLMQKVKPINKFNIASLLRNKGRFFFASICIAASVMLIFSAISVIASKNFTLNQTFAGRIHYDCQIFFREEPDQEIMDKLEELEYLSDIQKLLYFELPVTVGEGEGEKSRMVTVNAIQPDTTLLSIPGRAEDTVKAGDGEIVLDLQSAKELNVKEGDIVKVDGIPFKVSAVSRQGANWISYITLSDAKKIGDPDFGCLICRIPDEKHQEFLAYLTGADIEEYLYTIYMEPFYRSNLALFDTYDLLAWILNAFSILVGFVIVLNTTLTNLQEQKRELSVLVSLGFRHGEISRSRFLQTFLQFLVSTPLGLLGGFLFVDDALDKVSTVDEAFFFVSGFKEYAVTILLVFSYLLVSHLIAMRTMKKWNIPENIKDKE